jgi:hypothetical protein
MTQGPRLARLRPGPAARRRHHSTINTGSPWVSQQPMRHRHTATGNLADTGRQAADPQARGGREMSDHLRALDPRRPAGTGRQAPGPDPRGSQAPSRQQGQHPRLRESGWPCPSPATTPAGPRHHGSTAASSRETGSWPSGRRPGPSTKPGLKRLHALRITPRLVDQDRLRQGADRQFVPRLGTYRTSHGIGCQGRQESK